MKDEEMANESLIIYRKEPKWAGKMFMQDENTCYKDGFLAGLKAGKAEAKDLIRNLLRVTYGEGWNYSLDWKVKAEQFLKE